MPLLAATARSIPVLTTGGSVRNSGTAWRCMLLPIKARFASSCSRKGISAAETETVCRGLISTYCTSLLDTVAKSPCTRANTGPFRNE